LFERKTGEEECKVNVDPMSDDGLKNQNGYSSSVSDTEQSSSRSTDVFDISNESCFSTTAIDFSNQTLNT